MSSRNVVVGLLASGFIVSPERACKRHAVSQGVHIVAHPSSDNHMHPASSFLLQSTSGTSSKQTDSYAELREGISASMH